MPERTEARKIALPEWNVAKAFILSVTRSPLGLGQRLRCYGLIASWVFKYHRRIARDLFIASQAAAAETSAKRLPLDLSTPRGESI
jgi:hypothetical protein